MLSPTAAAAALPQHLSWDTFDPAMAAAMARQFERCLRKGHTATSAALKVVSPELVNARSERLKRLARFTVALLRSQRKISQLVAAGVTLRQLHDSVLAAKLELFRYMTKVIIREVELVFPEGAAALEHLVQAHYTFFAMYMSERVRTPTMHRVQLLQRLQLGDEEGGGEVGGGEVGGGGAAIASLRHRAASAPASAPTG